MNVDILDVGAGDEAVRLSRDDNDAPDGIIALRRAEVVTELLEDSLGQDVHLHKGNGKLHVYLLTKLSPSSSGAVWCFRNNVARCGHDVFHDSCVFTGYLEALFLFSQFGKWRSVNNECSVTVQD